MELSLLCFFVAQKEECPANSGELAGQSVKGQGSGKTRVAIQSM